MSGGQDLPAGWTAHLDPDTKFTYYFHAATGESRWEKPVVAGAFKPAAPSGAPTQAQQVFDKKMRRLTLSYVSLCLADHSL